jgi:thiol-disulfide isomerase/thioredoxin
VATAPDATTHPVPGDPETSPGDARARRILVLAGLLVLIALWGAGVLADGAASGEPDVSRILGTRQLRGLDGRTLTLGDLRGEIVVVNFWATWCKPCTREMPLFDALNARMQRAGRVVAISIDRDPARVTRFVEEHGLRLPVFVDGPDGLATSLDLEFLPYTVVLDATGDVAFAGPVKEGKPWQEFTTLVDRLTASIPAAPGREGAAAQ